MTTFMIAAFGGVVIGTILFVAVSKVFDKITNASNREKHYGWN